MSEPRFAAEHREHFEKLLKIGEVYAINLQPEGLPFGPWALGCNFKDDDKADRLKSRFCVAVRKAAIAAGAPSRANLLDWWMSRLAKNKNRHGLDCLIQRSIELCEQFEEDSAELSWKMQSAAVPSLRRDQYATNFEVPYWLYVVPHDSLPDAKTEFEHWKDHVWECFRKWLQALERNEVRAIDGSVYTHDLRKRQAVETRLAFHKRIARRVQERYELLKSALQCLGFDLAVLLANFVLDRGLTGAGAIEAFDADSVRLMEEMQACWKDSSRRLGLSWRKQLKDGKNGFDMAKPFRLVSDDLAILVGATRPTGLESSALQPGTETGFSDQSAAQGKKNDSTQSQKDKQSPRPKKPARRNKKYEKIDHALQKIADSRPRTQKAIFKSLDDRHVVIPLAEPFVTAKGWMAGFSLNSAAARAWLSKRWAELGLPSLLRGPKSPTKSLQ